MKTLLVFKPKNHTIELLQTMAVVRREEPPSLNFKNDDKLCRYITQYVNQSFDFLNFIHIIRQMAKNSNFYCLKVVFCPKKNLAIAMLQINRTWLIQAVIASYVA